VLFGRCDEDMGVPYQPFVEALNAYLGAATPDDVREHAGPTGGALTTLLPRVGELVPGLPEPVRADPETERYQQFEAVRAFLASLAQAGPVVLVLDDLHWAAQPTLLLLRHLLRGEEATAMVVLGTYRDTDLSRSHPLAAVLADLRRAPNVERVDLQGLPVEEVAELIASAAGQPLDDTITELAQQVWTETEGNPFFVGQVLRHLVETRAVVQDDDGRWRRGPNAGAVGLPEGVREVIGRRLSRLADDTNTTLALAAVIGREFDAALLVEASDAGADAVFDALEQAEEARLLIPVAGKPGRYGFAHALVRSTLYDELPTTRRLRLHRRIGQALEQRGDKGSADELARHWSEAAALGDTDRALRYCAAAAAQAKDRLAHEEAADWYERALAVLDPDHGDHAAEAELHIALGDVLWSAGNHAPSREHFDRAIELARRAGDAELFARAAIGRGGRRRAWVDAGLVDDALVAGLEEALELLPPTDSALRAWVMSRLAAELYFRPQDDDRRTALADEALAMARRTGDPDTLSQVLAAFHWGAWVPGNAAERLEMARELGALALQAGNREVEAIGYQFTVVDKWELGDIDGVRAAIRDLRTIYEQLRLAEGAWVVTVMESALAFFEGRIDDADRLSNEAMVHAEPLQSPTAVQMYGIQQFGLRRLRGGMADMIPLTEAMVAEYPAIPSWRTGLAFSLAEVGDLDGARDQLDILAPDRFGVIPRDANWHVGLAVCALVAEAVGAEEEGAVLADLLAPYNDFWVCAGLPADCVGPGSYFTGVAAAAAGRLDHAEQLLSTAVDACRERHSPRLVAEGGVALARVLARRGDHDRARTLAEECIRLCDEFGMPAIKAKAEAVLAG
jgi:tetratricopeptide (TPR) repeat protein